MGDVYKAAGFTNGLRIPRAENFISDFANRSNSGGYTKAIDTSLESWIAT